MFEYFNAEDESVGVAFSLRKCNKVKMGHKHEPHPYVTEHSHLGPYMCHGYPAVYLIALPKSKEEVPMRFTMIKDDDGLPAVRAVV